MAIIAFHCSSHSVVSRSEIAESKKGMDAATTRSMTEESKQDDGKQPRANAPRHGPWQNNARSMSHSETGKARRGYPEDRKDMDPATDTQHDIGGHNRVPLFKSFCRFTK